MVGVSVAVWCAWLLAYRAAGAAILMRDGKDRRVDLADTSIPCFEAFFANLPELAARPVTLTAPVANNGQEMRNQLRLTQLFFDAAVKAQRACVQQLGRYYGMRGLLPAEAAAALQAGASPNVHWGICVPRQCKAKQVADTLAGLFSQFIIGLPTPPRLTGVSSAGPPEISELGDWASLRVDFVIAGFAKCGTTALAKYLDRHPELQLADVGAGSDYFEDTFFLTADLLPSQQIIQEFRHRHRVPHAAVKIGIKYPHLLFRDLAMMKLHRVNPSLLFVLLIRDPIDWLESTFRWYDVINATPPSFAVHALGRDPASTGLRVHGREAHFGFWVARMTAEFGFNRSQVYLTHLEALDRPAAARLCAFLGARGAPPGELPAANVNTWSGFDLCAAIQTDLATLNTVVQLKAELALQYKELPRLLAENGEVAPRHLLTRRSRCERLWWGDG